MSRDRRETLGQRLQRLRRAAGLTQAEFAGRAGVPLKSVLNWEQDRRQPRIDAVVDLARHLGVSLEELLTNLAPREQRPPAQRGRPPSKRDTRKSNGKGTADAGAAPGASGRQKRTKGA